MLADIAISHSGRDSRVASRIAKSLKARGLDVWLDPDGLIEGRITARMIVEHVDLAKVMIFIISKNTSGGDWAEYGELDAWEHIARNYYGWARPPIFPIVVDDCEIPPGLRYYKSYRWTGTNALIDEVETDLRASIVEMPIFINYRRADSQDECSTIYEYFCKKIGTSRVFRDINAIPAGRDFEVELRTALSKCSCVLSLVGAHWLEILRERQDEASADDHVVKEIEMALQMQKSVLPVIIGMAQFPKPSDLPVSIRPFSKMNAVRLDPQLEPPSLRRLFAITNLTVIESSSSMT